MRRSLRLETIRRWHKYGFYDWTQGMPRSKRVVTWAAISIQGFAVWFVLSRSQLWPYMIREKKLALYLSVFLLYLFGDRVMHALVTSEVIRKSQLEADQIAAMKIQRTLQPDKLDPVAGTDVSRLGLVTSEGAAHA